MKVYWKFSLSGYLIIYLLFIYFLVNMKNPTPMTGVNEQHSQFLLDRMSMSDDASSAQWITPFFGA